MNAVFILIIVNVYVQTSSGWLLPLRKLHHKPKRQTKFDAFIVGGKTANIEEYPWLAQVLRLEDTHCGGVVVSQRVVLTAAHCLVDDERATLDPEDFAVLLGSTATLEGTRYDVCQIRIHKKYFDHKSPPYFHDLALVLLSTEIELNKQVKIAKIAPDWSWKKTRYTFVVAGYGVTSNDFTDAEQLLKTRLRFISRADCNRSPTDYGELPVPEHIFCLISDKINTGDCVGDSGSGVMWGNYVVGIVSHGRANICASDKPSMYVDLTYFRKWIKEKIQYLERKSLDTCK